VSGGQTQNGVSIPIGYTVSQGPATQQILYAGWKGIATKPIPEGWGVEGASLGIR
jgi:hypothetical protein